MENNQVTFTIKLAGVSGTRIVGWSYDGIYRLTNENVTADPGSNTGAVTYNLDFYDSTKNFQPWEYA
jgi:hypothetical protein